MAYNRVNWLNNISTPVNATNLNIMDAALLDHDIQLPENTNDYSYTLGFLNGLNQVRTRAILLVHGFYSLNDGASGKYRVLAVSGSEVWTDIKDPSNNTLFQQSDTGEIRAVGNTKKLKIMPHHGEYNVKLFGVVGQQYVHGVPVNVNTSQDDTKALQNAFNVAANNSNSTLVLGANELYMITDTITYKYTNLN